MLVDNIENKILLNTIDATMFSVCLPAIVLEKLMISKINIKNHEYAAKTLLETLPKSY